MALNHHGRGSNPRDPTETKRKRESEQRNLFGEFTEFSCHACDKHLLLASHSTLGKIQAAAAAGNEEAKAQLTNMKLEDQKHRCHRQFDRGVKLLCLVDWRGWKSIAWSRSFFWHAPA